MTALTIAQEACDQLQGIARPTTLVSSSDPGVQQMLRLLNQAGRSLARDHDWSTLVTVRSFTALAQQAQTGEPPADYDRMVSGGQLFDVSRRLPLGGSVDQNRFNWLVLQSGPPTTTIMLSESEVPEEAPIGTEVGTLSVAETMAAGGLDKWWTLIGGVINITPWPTGTEVYRYSYVSKNWCDGGDKFTADTDTTDLNEELLILSLIWRWNRAKGLDYAEDMRNFEIEKERMIARDKGPRDVRTAHIFNGALPGNFWPDVIG